MPKATVTTTSPLQSSNLLELDWLLFLSFQSSTNNEVLAFTSDLPAARTGGRKNTVNGDTFRTRGISERRERRVRGE